MATFGAMHERFDGSAGAFAYLLFVLLYFPCVAAIAAVRRETTVRWTLFVGAWTTGLAYVVATVYYQAATFAQHPGSSAAWIAGMLSAFVISVIAMRIYGKSDRRAGSLAGSAQNA
jgi:ferrous iron transport protein B